MSFRIKMLSVILMLFSGIKVFAQDSVADVLNMSISQAREYALENNYKMKNSRLDVLAANKRVWEATSLGLPQIDGKIDYTDNLTISTIPLTITDATGKENTSYIQMGSPHSVSAGLTVSQLIFDGSYIVGLQSAQVYKNISELAEFKSETLVEEAVTNAYGGAVLNEEIVKILKGNVETLQKNLDQTKAFYEAGLVEEQNVEQLQILLSSTKNLLYTSERDKEISYQMLNYTLGLDINTHLNLTNGIEFLLLENVNMDIVNKQFNVENNIDFSIQENQVRLKELLKNLEQAKYLPSISAFYNTKQDAFSDKFDFFSSDTDWFGGQVIGVSLKIPIFSSGQRHAKVQQAKIELEKSKISQQDVSQELKLNFERAKNVYLSSVNRYYTAKDNMELSKKIREKEAVKFFEGMSSSLDLSNAEVQMYETQKAYVQSIQALVQAKAAIDKFMRVKPETEK